MGGRRRERGGYYLSSSHITEVTFTVAVVPMGASATGPGAAADVSRLFCSNHTHHDVNLLTTNRIVYIVLVKITYAVVLLSLRRLNVATRSKQVLPQIAHLMALLLM